MLSSSVKYPVFFFFGITLISSQSWGLLSKGALVTNDMDSNEIKPIINLFCPYLLILFMILFAVNNYSLFFNGWIISQISFGNS